MEQNFSQGKNSVAFSLFNGIILGDVFIFLVLTGFLFIIRGEDFVHEVFHYFDFFFYLLFFCFFNFIFKKTGLFLVNF